jgi:voltage-gated potassium channel
MNNKQYVVIIGWDDFANNIAKQILNAGKSILIISDNKNTIAAINSRKQNIEQIKTKFIEYNNFIEIEKVDLENSLAVLINLKDDIDKLSLTINLKRHFNIPKLIVPIDHAHLKNTFSNAGVQYPISKDEFAAKMVSSYLFEYDVALYLEDILASAVDDSDYDIQQYKVLQDNPYCGMDYVSAFKDLKIKYNVVLIGLSKYNNGNRTLLKNPPDSTKIQEDDYLIVIVNGKNAKELISVFNIEEGFFLNLDGPQSIKG